MERAEQRIRVRVVYALPDRQSIVEVKIAADATVADAVAGSGLAVRFPEMAAQPLMCAIFGRVVPLAERLHDGDRVEILRPLIADPKETRRQAAVRTRKR